MNEWQQMQTNFRMNEEHGLGICLQLTVDVWAFEKDHMWMTSVPCDNCIGTNFIHPQKLLDFDYGESDEEEDRKDGGNVQQQLPG